jgi:hypothetical protein
MRGRLKDTSDVSKLILNQNNMFELTHKDGFKKVCQELSKRLSNIPYDNADMSDVGNEIGIIIAKYFNDEDNGWDVDSFITGLRHGISLTDGTHG